MRYVSAVLIFLSMHETEQTLFLHPSSCALRSTRLLVLLSERFWLVWALDNTDVGSHWAELPKAPRIMRFSFSSSKVSPVTLSLLMCISLQRQIQCVNDSFPLRFLNWWPHTVGGIAVVLGTFWSMTARITVMSCLWPWCLRCWTDKRVV